MRIWHEQQRQKQQGDSRSCGKRQWDRHDGNHNVEGVAGNCSKHNVIKEDESFQLDIRIHGETYNVMDEERITNIQTFG